MNEYKEEVGDSAPTPIEPIDFEDNAQNSEEDDILKQIGNRKLEEMSNEEVMKLVELTEKKTNKLREATNTLDNDTRVRGNMEFAKIPEVANEIDTVMSEPEQLSYDKQIDYIRLDIAAASFELARLHHNIGNIDSANYYYHLAAESAPKTMEQSSRYIYVYSESIRDTNQ